MRDIVQKTFLHAAILPSFVFHTEFQKWNTMNNRLPVKGGAP